MLAADEVKVTEPPEQKVVGPPGVMIGVAGALGPVRVCTKVFELQPEATVKVML